LSEIKIDYSENKIYGDYSTSIAMQIARFVKKNPVEVAELLASKLQVLGSRFLGRAEVAKPGFINFYLSKEYLQKKVKEILESGEKFGNLKIGKNKKIQVEFISANPTGPLTVGNARGGPLGDVLGNVLERAGFRLEKAYYINDYGMQILTLGHSVLKDSQAKYRGAYIDELAKKIKIKEPYKAGEKAAEIIIKMIKKTTDRMGIEYDEWISEKKLYKLNAVEKVLRFLKKKNLVCEKEGAIWFKSSKFGDERDRVVVKSDSWKTYLAGDMALHQYKFKNKKFDKVINIWGADHYGDVPGLQAGITALGFKGKLDIILLQFVTLFEKGREIKMSKRLGTFVTMDELIDMVGIDAVRFFFLQKSASTHLNFDLELAKEQSEKNPVYYIQYANARICSILRKVSSSKPRTLDFRLLDHPSELNLIKQLVRFPEIIEDTAKDYQVQRIPQYALDLATAFHRFYRDCRVLSEDRKLTKARLSLVSSAQIVFRNILDLMGISAPEKM
jgi:arginyl-tRNA synthetase